MLAQWGNSRESGYMVFAWTWAGKSLSSKPDLLDIFRRFNGGAAGCVVPRVIGSTLGRAKGLIRRANCSVGTVSRRYSTRRSGRVLSQFPRAGTQLAAKGRIRVVVSKGHRA
jgi:beta-lactam-binding protein with PASTA domain